MAKYCHTGHWGQGTGGGIHEENASLNTTESIMNTDFTDNHYQEIYQTMGPCDR